MSVNWSWKHKQGYFYFKSIDNRCNKRVRVNFYGANCLGALIHDFKEVDKETGKIREMYDFVGFWNDLHHLYRCLGLEKSYHQWSRTTKTYSNIYKNELVSVHLNIFYREMIAVAKAFAKAGFKVHVYYKEIE